MRIDRIKAAKSQGGIEISAHFHGEGAGPGTRLWFEVKPADQVPQCPADAFVAGALLPAMIQGRDLRIDGPVSDTLLRSCDRIQDIYTGWVRHARRVRITPCSVVGQPACRSEAVGSFFSGGVDSFYTLHLHRRELTHLLFVRGFDIPLDDHWRHGQAMQSALEVAHLENKGLIEVVTNIRSLTDRYVSWDYAHGAALGAVALVCSGLLGKVFIPPSFSVNQLRPWGSHPLLDPLWSNGQIEIVHDGWKAAKTERVLVGVCRSDLALRTLRVCWKNLPGMLNCGRCEKCIRTMLCLHIGGVLDRCQTLPHRIPLAHTAMARLPSRQLVMQAQEIAGALPSDSVKDILVKMTWRLAILRARIRLAMRILAGKDL